MKRQRSRPERDGPHEPSLHTGLLRVAPVKVTALTGLIGVQGLLKLLLQDLIPPL